MGLSKGRLCLHYTRLSCSLQYVFILVPFFHSYSNTSVSHSVMSSFRKQGLRSNFEIGGGGCGGHR